MNRVVKGLVIGGIIAASATALYTSGWMRTPTARRMMKKGKNFVKRSSDYVNDVADIIR